MHHLLYLYSLLSQAIPTYTFFVTPSFSVWPQSLFDCKFCLPFFASRYFTMNLGISILIGYDHCCTTFHFISGQTFPHYLLLIRAALPCNQIWQLVFLIQTWNRAHNCMHCYTLSDPLGNNIGISNSHANSPLEEGYWRLVATFLHVSWIFFGIQ